PKKGEGYEEDTEFEEDELDMDNINESFKENVNEKLVY
ncbi:hypothetical protein, partial [Plasmodium yoelii yoelii]